MNLNSSAALESVSPYTPQTRTLGEKFINTQIMSFLLANKRVFQIGGDESARSMACCENHAHILLCGMLKGLSMLIMAYKRLCSDQMMDNDV